MPRFEIRRTVQCICMLDAPTEKLAHRWIAKTFLKVDAGMQVINPGEALAEGAEVVCAIGDWEIQEVGSMHFTALSDDAILVQHPQLIEAAIARSIDRGQAGVLEDVDDFGQPIGEQGGGGGMLLPGGYTHHTDTDGAEDGVEALNM